MNSKEIKDFNKIDKGSSITNNCRFSMQEDVEARSCHPKVRSRGRIIVVPPEGNQMRTRSSKSELNSPGKECGIPSRRTRERKVKD